MLTAQARALKRNSAARNLRIEAFYCLLYRGCLPASFGRLSPQPDRKDSCRPKIGHFSIIFELAARLFRIPLAKLSNGGAFAPIMVFPEFFFYVSSQIYHRGGVMRVYGISRFFANP